MSARKPMNTKPIPAVPPVQIVVRLDKGRMRIASISSGGTNPPVKTNKVSSNVPVNKL